MEKFKNQFNVIDSLKDKTKEEIIQYCQNNTCNAAAAMFQIEGDFNFSSLIRGANFFGLKEVFHIGKKRFDSRGAVGCHHYTKITHCSDFEYFVELAKNYTIIAIENNIPEYSYKTFELFDYITSNLFSLLKLGGKPPLFLFGEENSGLTKEILDFCPYIITIKGYGSIRSLNVAACAALVFGCYRNKLM